MGHNGAAWQRGKGALQGHNMGHVRQPQSSSCGGIALVAKGGNLAIGSKAKAEHNRHWPLFFHFCGCFSIHDFISLLICAVVYESNLEW